MSIKTTIGALKLALQCVLKAVDTKQVTAEFIDGQLMMHACANQGHAKARVHTEGSLPDMVFPLTGKVVLAIINNCESDTVCTIGLQNEDLRLKFGKASIKLSRYTEKEVDFFNWTAKDQRTTSVCTFEPAKFRKALAAVAHFHGVDQTRYQLRGVLLQSMMGKLVLAASNGLRLAEKITDMPTPEFAPVIVGGEYAEALVGIIKGDELIEFSLVGTTDVIAVVFSTSNFSIKCPLIGGVYPPYRSIIPGRDRSVTINATSLMVALERMKSVASDQSNFIRLAFKDDALHVLTMDGESSEIVDAVGVDFELNLAMQPELFHGLLSSASTERVCLGVEPSKGAHSFITVENTDDDGWLGLVTPALV